MMKRLTVIVGLSVAGCSPHGSPFYKLSDKNGRRVEAMIYLHDVGDAKDFGTPDSKCVGLTMYKKRLIGTAYELKSGTIAPCYEESESWEDALGASLHFLDADCLRPLINVGSRENVGGTMYYGPNEDSLVEGTTIYWKLVGECEVRGVSFGLQTLPKPIPNDVLELLPDAPYTLSMVY